MHGKNVCSLMQCYGPHKRGICQGLGIIRSVLKLVCTRTCTMFAGEFVVILESLIHTPVYVNIGSEEGESSLAHIVHGSCFSSNCLSHLCEQCARTTGITTLHGQTVVALRYSTVIGCRPQLTSWCVPVTPPPCPLPSVYWNQSNV